MELTTQHIDKVMQNLESRFEKETININITPAKTEITQSKFGGTPYATNVNDIPVSVNGNQLALLAQINCSELPRNNIYPETGLMQFWIDGSENMGLDFDDATSQKYHRVTYIETVDNSITEEHVKSFYNPIKDDMPFEASDEFALEFTAGKDNISAGSYNFEENFVEEWNKNFPENSIEDIWDDLGDDLGEYLFDNFTPSGHKIGGEPYFTQNDVREYNEGYDILLLQLDTDSCEDERGHYNIIWGDCGVANFFITAEQLKEKDFSKVLFTWDCC